MRRAIAFGVGAVLAAAQTVPRPAAAFTFQLSPKMTATKLAEYARGKLVLLYLFSPD